MTFGGCIMILGRSIGTRGGTLPMISTVLALNTSAIRSGPFVFLSRIPLLKPASFLLFGIMCTSVRLIYALMLQNSMRSGTVLVVKCSKVRYVPRKFQYVYLEVL